MEGKINKQVCDFCEKKKFLMAYLKDGRKICIKCYNTEPNKYSHLIRAVRSKKGEVNDI